MQILDVTVKTWAAAQAEVQDIINGQDGYTVTRMSLGLDRRVGYCLERGGRVVARVNVNPQQAAPRVQSIIELI